MSDASHLPALERYAQKQPEFLPGDAAAATGLSLHEIRTGLEELMKKYECRLQVTDKGQLVYRFGRRKGSRTTKEMIAELSEKAYKVFTVVFKFCIAAFLLAYFVLFLVILIAIIVISIASIFSSDGDGGDIDVDVGGAFFILGDIFRAIFIWDMMSAETYYHTDERGYRYRKYKPKPSRMHLRKKQKGKKVGEPKKSFVYSVYDYVFGEARYQPHEKANEREVAAFLRTHKGIITPREVLSLNGLSKSAYEKLFSESLIQFEGKPEVSREGVLYGDFGELTQQVSDTKDADVVYYWNEYEAAYELTGNSSGRNILITFLNGFNLVFGWLGITGFFNTVFGMPHAAWLPIALGWVPFVFSLVFFCIPMIRYVRLQPLRRQRHQTNIRKRVMRTIFESEAEYMSLPEIREATNLQAKSEEPLTEKQVAEVMEELAYDLEAEMSIREADAAMVYDFRPLRREEREAARLRAERGNASDRGAIVFDTQE